MRREFQLALSCWQRYLDAEPWSRIDSDAIFRDDDEKSGESYYASILGHQGTLYGLALSRGEEGLRVMGGLVEQDVDSIRRPRRRRPSASRGMMGRPRAGIGTSSSSPLAERRGSADSRSST